MHSPPIFVRRRWHVHRTPDLLLTRIRSNQHRQPFARVEPIGLGPASAPIHFNTGLAESTMRLVISRLAR